MASCQRGNFWCVFPCKLRHHVNVAISTVFSCTLRHHVNVDISYVFFLCVTVPCQCGLFWSFPCMLRHHVIFLVCVSLLVTASCQRGNFWCVFPCMLCIMSMWTFLLFSLYVTVSCQCGLSWSSPCMLRHHVIFLVNVVISGVFLVCYGIMSTWPIQVVYPHMSRKMSQPHMDEYWHCIVNCSMSNLTWPWWCDLSQHSYCAARPANKG